jgi:hypothetical protein
VDAGGRAAQELSACDNPLTPCTDEQRAQLEKTISYPQTLFVGDTILTGMFGLDGEHEMKAELHPLYAIATLRSSYENDPKDDVWLIFARNQGDEEYCSSQIWDADFEDYTFKLPWHRDGVIADVNWDKTKFYGPDGTSGPTVSVIPPPSLRLGVYVTFHLGPAVHNSSLLQTSASVPYIYGELNLAWTIPELKPGAPAKAGTIAAQQTPVQTLAGQSSGVKTVIGATAATDVDEIEQMG